MALVEILIGTGILLFFVLIVLLIVVIIKSTGKMQPRPVREDLEKIKAQIEDREY